MDVEIRVQDTPLDALAETAPVFAGRPSVGGVVSFIGLMRDINHGDAVNSMTLEHYPGMTEKALAAIVDEAGRRWDLQGVRVLHRVGEIRPQDPIVLVAVASAHRGEAFRACEFIIDYLKTRAPFWKREQTADGGTRWVEARASDEHAAAGWGEP
ncbi:MAG: molybdopterin synthase catalytic subunit MoaE [Chromatiaceae bacterium]|jgi:molybdopterin synthase catalytic subunit|nr:molybdopterin synthase catalytic subunit MoaE [Chromatiaceae bacterium]